MQCRVARAVGRVESVGSRVGLADRDVAAVDLAGDRGSIGRDVVLSRSMGKEMSFALMSVGGVKGRLSSP